MIDLPQLTRRRSLSCSRALKQTSAHRWDGEEAEKIFCGCQCMRSLRDPSIDVEWTSGRFAEFYEEYPQRRHREEPDRRAARRTQTPAPEGDRCQARRLPRGRQRAILVARPPALI